MKKATPRAGQRALAGQIWPAGCTLPTPGVNGHLASMSVVLGQCAVDTFQVCRQFFQLTLTYFCEKKLRHEHCHEIFSFQLCCCIYNDLDQHSFLYVNSKRKIFLK